MSKIHRTAAAVLLLGTMLNATALDVLVVPLFKVQYQYPSQCKLSQYFGLEGDRDGVVRQGVQVTRDGLTLQKYSGRLGDGTNDFGRGSKFGHIRYDLAYIQSPGSSDDVQITTVKGVSRREKYVPFDLFKHLYDPGEFSEKLAADYLVNAVRVACNLEINAEFGVDAIQSNFRRLGTRFDRRVAYKTSAGFNVFQMWPEWNPHLEFPNLYVLMIDSSPVLYEPEIVPYRNGSKASIKIFIPAIPSTPNSVDFVPWVKKAKDQLERIVNN